MYNGCNIILWSECNSEDGESDCDNESDTESIDDRPTAYALQTEYYPFYNRTIEKLPKAFVTKTTRSVQEMIKRNSAKNVTILNKKIYELFHMDPTFREMLLCVKWSRFTLIT